MIDSSSFDARLITAQSDRTFMVHDLDCLSTEKHAIDRCHAGPPSTNAMMPARYRKSVS
jgi:hypothetical protein